MIFLGKILSMFNGLDFVFFLMAVFGGVLFAIRMTMAMLGLGHHDAAISMDHSGDFSSGSGDNDSGFRMLSVQGMSVFLLMFGLVGLALHHGSGLGDIVSIFGGFIAGIVTMMLLAKVIQLMMKLQSSGNINIAHAVGTVATVYLHIPSDGSGQVQINIDGRQRIFDAVSEDKQAVKTGERVQVARVLDERTLVVKRV